MFARVLFLTIALLPVTVMAATYKSGYGFEFQLSDDWLVVTPERLAQFKDKNLDIKGLTKEAEQAVLQRVGTGRIEYYFDRKHSSKDFTSNISVQGNVRAVARTEDDAKAACERMPGQLKALYGDKVKVQQCELKKIDGVPYMAYEYSGAAPGVTTVQDEFQLTPNLALIVVGASEDPGMPALRKGVTSVVQGIGRHIKKSPDYFSLLDKAINAYNAGNYEQARKDFEPLAEVGDPDGLYNLGVMHARGEGGPKEPAKAMQYYRRAAAAGNANAMTNLASHYYYGDGVEKDETEAAKWYALAARAGVPLAQRYYGVMLIKGTGVKQNVAEGADWLMQAALRGDKLAGENLVRLLKPEAEKGHLGATHVLGLMYLQGVAGVEQDEQKGLGLLQRAAEGGHKTSQNALAQIYANGMFGVAKDSAKAAKWAEAAKNNTGSAK